MISVAALTAVLERGARQRPIAGRRQVFLIDPAEAMEPEGVARYLKALEEPPRGHGLRARHDARRPPAGDRAESRAARAHPAGVRSRPFARAWRPTARTRPRPTRSRAGPAVRSRARVASRATGVPDVVSRARRRGVVRRAARRRPSSKPRSRRSARMRPISPSRHGRRSAGSQARSRARPADRRPLRAQRRGARRWSRGARDAGLLAASDADAVCASSSVSGALAAAVPANVTPAVVLVEAVRILRCELRVRRSVAVRSSRTPGGPSLFAAIGR